MLNRTAFFTLFSTLLCTFSLSSFAQTQSEWQNPQYIFKAFKEIALKNEYTATDQQILKWQQPIRYRFHYAGLKKSQLVETLFNEQLSHLSSITMHPISQKHQNVNLDIYLTKDSHYAEVIKQYTQSNISNLGRESHCMGSFKTLTNGEIISGQIVIPIDHVFSRGLLVSCIVEETTQLMGLPNDSDWVQPTIANDKSKIEFLTGLDYIMLKILYSKEIKAGMKGKLLDQKITNAIKQMSINGTIQQAAKQVNRQGLYPLSN